MAKHLESGKKAEALALEYLQRQGLKIIVQNWQCLYGEIDLIMEQDKQLHFIEVRFRKQTKWGLSQETVNHVKQQKLIKTAMLFLQRHQQHAIKHCQFDIIAINGDLDINNITWLANAFSLT